MAYWAGKSAIVTGAASGIGLALSEAMLERGAEVWMADINLAALEEAAARLGEKAHPVELDVRDAPACQALVNSVVEQTGRIDFLFNNAGIGVGGELHELTVAHFDRIIDINIRGVCNGTAAAYPVMVKQGSGHIINTASAAGLLPGPLLTPYGMTKHAVVGWTIGHRLEAEHYGVRVSALCPTAIETPILDSEGPPDLPKPWRPDARRFLSRLGGPPFPVRDFANYALTKIEQNQGIIVAPASGRMAVFLYRFFPGLVLGRIRKALDMARKERQA